MTDFREIFTKGPKHRPTQVFIAVILGLAILGFFVGMEQTSLEVEGLASFARTSGTAKDEGLQARSYIELLEDPLKKNEQWLGSIDELARETTPGLLEEIENPEAGKAETLAFRATRRAYAGAPPTIPHPVKEYGDFSCLACHREGVTINGRLAPPMSHEVKTQCTQCHIVSQPPMPGARTDSYLLSTENTFVGMPEAHDGERAWPGAPATIPHSTQMRTNCMSCHGLNGREGLRTSHPWRQNCQQCHMPNADLEAQPTPNMPFPTP